MKIVSLNLLGDPAAVGRNLVSAIRKHTAHTARHVKDSTRNMMTDFRDLVSTPYHHEHIREIIHEADVLHFNQVDWAHESFDPYRSAMHSGQRVLFHGHGGSWLLNPEPQIARARALGAGIVVCSPMDTAVVPCSTWIPNILNMEGVAPDWDRDYTGDLIIGLAANNSNGLYKGAEMVRYMADYLGHREHGFPVQFELITNRTLAAALETRTRHHFTVDNWVQGFTGMQGFEGLALGHVVFGRFDIMVHRAWGLFAPEMIPVVRVKGFDTCAMKIREYCNDRHKLIEDSRGGYEWIHKWYTDERIVKMWIDYYEKLEPITTT